LQHYVLHYNFFKGGLSKNFKDHRAQQATHKLQYNATVVTSANYYAALLPRRGPHIASHLSVRLSSCPSRYRYRASRRATWRITMTHMYFSARTEGRISYGHLGRTEIHFLIRSKSKIS